MPPLHIVRVIGKTKSVYIPDPKKAKEPVRSEPLPESDFIGEDDDISADDVDDILEPMDEEDLQELMEPGLSGCRSRLPQAMTYDDINNMVAVASGANKDETDTIRAVETLYSIRQSDIYEFILSESDNKDRIERLMNERFDEKPPRISILNDLKHKHPALIGANMYKHYNQKGMSCNVQSIPFLIYGIYRLYQNSKSSISRLSCIFCLFLFLRLRYRQSLSNILNIL